MNFAELFHIIHLIVDQYQSIIGRITTSTIAAAADAVRLYRLVLIL